MGGIKQKKQRWFLAGYKCSAHAEAIRTEAFQRARSDILILAAILWACASSLCLQMISKRRRRVKRFILKSHSLTAEKLAATLLCNTPCISSTAWITCTAAANSISSECRLTLPRSLTDLLREYQCFSLAPLFTIHCLLPRSRHLVRNLTHTPVVAPNRLETKNINVNNPWRDEWWEGRAQSIPLKFWRSVLLGEAQIPWLWNLNHPPRCPVLLGIFQKNPADLVVEGGQRARNSEKQQKATQRERLKTVFTAKRDECGCCHGSIKHFYIQNIFFCFAVQFYSWLAFGKSRKRVMLNIEAHVRRKHISLMQIRGHSHTGDIVKYFLLALSQNVKVLAKVPCGSDLTHWKWIQLTFSTAWLAWLELIPQKE